MEVSNEIKEDIRKTQSDLKNAIRVHQVWVERLQDDDKNLHLKIKVKDAEKAIIAIGQSQKLVVERLRRELELYQQRLIARNRRVNKDDDNSIVAQQLRDYQKQGRSKNRPISLLKPSVLNEIHIKSENNHNEYKNGSDSENDTRVKAMSNYSAIEDQRHKYSRNFLPAMVHDSRSKFANALNKVKETLSIDWQDQRSDSDSSGMLHHSPSPSPPPLPDPRKPITQEAFLRLVGLVTPAQKEVLDKKRSERRKRATTSTNKTDFLYGNFDMMPKRKKFNQFPYLQAHHDPPQTRSAKLRKQQFIPKTSREGSPSGSSSDNKGWTNGKPAWASALPPGLSVEPIYPTIKKECHACGRNDVPSLLVWCGECGVCVHTGCGADGRCANCRAPLPDPACAASPPSDPQLYKDKLAERKRLQERNLELSVELRKLEARAASLKENLDEHNAEKRQLLADQIKVQRNLQKLLDFISQFKDTSLSMRSTSSETGSEISKSNEE